MNSNMKTITLDDEAYERLKSWKRQKGDSFSFVVKQMVPRAGTLEAMARFVSKRSSVSERQDGLMQEAIENRPAGKHDPWT